MSFPVEVVVVGCGMPGRGMGWFHALQLLEGKCPSAQLRHVVEPWLLGQGATSPDGEAFAALSKEWIEKGVQFHATVGAVPPAAGRRCALLAGRTKDNPRLLREVVELAGCTHVMLEKPGAPSVAELKDMAEFARSNNVPVFVDFNKNVSAYVAAAREAECANPGSVIKFVSLNSYSRNSLEECFERNSEGMLKNMAIHELALATTFYDVTVESLDSIDVNHDACEYLTLANCADFAKLDFTLKSKGGKQVAIHADRCGGNGCEAVVSKGDEVLFQSSLPSKEQESRLREKEAAHPNWMPYFFLQEDDYITVKEMCAAHAGANFPGSPDGIATLKTAIEAMRLAEHLTPILQQRLAR